MKKTYLCLVMFNFLLISLSSQTFDWAKAEGLWAYDYGYGITNDNNGNVYVAGKYEENAIFSGTTISCRGNHDIYVAKYSAAGDLTWITTAGGVLGDYATSIACDNQFLYVAGEIEGYGVPVYFDNSAVSFVCQGSNDIFVAKYDLNGNLIWAKRAGAYKNDKALAVTYDNSGNVYIAGFFNDTAVFNGNYTIYGNGKNDIYLAKFDADGNFKWARNAGSNERDEAKSIKCDASGNVYITGMFSGTVAFGSHTLVSPNGYYDMFLAKYDTDGNVVWAKNAGSDYDEVGWGLEIDNQGKIYVAGEFNAYSIFDNVALTTTGNSDVFVACYDQNGSLQWAKGAGGSLIERARGIGTDGNNVYITGQFGATASFGTHTITAADSSDIFIAALNNSGDFIWAMSVGGVADSTEELSYESGNAVSSAGGYVYATGSLLTGGTFGGVTLEGYKRSDIFIAKISQVGAGLEDRNLFENCSVYPNPSQGQFTLELKESVSKSLAFTVYNYSGQAIENKQIFTQKTMVDLSGYERGIYFIEVRSGLSIHRGKIIVQ
jgi:hypothetical protein